MSSGTTSGSFDYMGLVTFLAALELPAGTRLALLPQGHAPPGTESIICESGHGGSVRCNATVVLSRHGLFCFFDLEDGSMKRLRRYKLFLQDNVTV
jgi:hypothetical protein